MPITTQASLAAIASATSASKWNSTSMELHGKHSPAESLAITPTQIEWLFGKVAASKFILIEPGNGAAQRTSPIGEQVLEMLRVESRKQERNVLAESTVSWVERVVLRTSSCSIKTEGTGPQPRTIQTDHHQQMSKRLAPSQPGSFLHSLKSSEMGVQKHRNSIFS